MADYRPIDDKKSVKNDEDFCKKVYDNIKKWKDHFECNEKAFKYNMKFLYGTQWSQSDYAKYVDRGRTPLTANLLLPIAIHICSEQLKNPPALSVKPITDDASDDDVKIRQDLIEKSSLSNNAKLAYQLAYHNMLCGGFGVLLAENYYENNLDLKQNVKVEAVEDPTNCFFDPCAQEIDKSDGSFCGKKNWRDKEEIEELYNIDFSNQKSALSEYLKEDKVCVIDYFERKAKTNEYVYLNTGQKIKKGKFGKFKQAFAMNGMFKVAERKITEYTVMRYKVVGHYILEKTKFPSKHMGYVFCQYDAYIDEESESHIKSFFENAYDSQRRFNQVVSDITHLSGEQESGKFLAHPANISDFSEYWTNDKSSQKILPYVPHVDKKSGQVIKPEPYNPPPISGHLMPIYESAKREIYEEIGTYHTQLGNQGQEHSGIAIRERSNQGNMTTYKSLDSLNRGIRQVGNITLDMISRLWTKEMKITLDRDGGENEEVVLNQLVNFRKYRDMSKGEYNVVIEPSVSFDSQKEAMTQDIVQFMELTQKPAFAIFGDKIAKAFPNLPYRNEMMKRAKQMLSPEVKKELGMQAPPPQPSPEQIKMNMEQAKLKLEQEKLQNDRLKQRHEMQKDQADMRLRAQENQQEAQQKRMENVIDLMKIKETEKQTYMRAAAEAHKINTEQQTTFQKEYLDMYKRLIDLEHKYSN